MVRFSCWVVLGLVGAVSGCNNDLGVLSYDDAPAVAITEPVDGAIFSEGESITFAGMVADDGSTEDLSVRWLSDVDQVLVEGLEPDHQGFVSFTDAVGVGVSDRPGHCCGVFGIDS